MNFPSAIQNAWTAYKTLQQIGTLKERLEDNLKKIPPVKLIAITVIGMIALKHLSNYFQPRFGQTFSEKIGGCLLRVVPGLSTKIEEMVKKHRLSFNKEFINGWASYGPLQLEIPEIGYKPQEILEKFYQWNELVEKKILSSVKSGELYAEVFLKKREIPTENSKDLSLSDLDTRIYDLLKYWNKMHKKDFDVGDFLNFQVIQMAANEFREKPLGKIDTDLQGFVTPGGTYSLFHAVHCYLSWGILEKGVNATEAVIIAPDTIHVAVDKACDYMHVKLVKIKTTKDGLFSLKEMKSLLSVYNDCTVAVFGSAGCYPLGVCDPLKEMGVLAAQFDLPFHVDACLGGFVIEYLDPRGHFWDDKNVTGFCTDPHKNLQSAKEVSIVAFRKKKGSKHNMAHYGSSAYPNWSGSVYASEGIAGSSSISKIASAYAAMTCTGKTRLENQAKAIQVAIQKMAKILERHSLIEIIGDFKLNVIAFRICPKKMLPGATYYLAKIMHQHGVTLSPIKGDAVHFCITGRFVSDLEGSLNKFEKALDKGLEAVPEENRRLLSEKKKTFQEMAAVYCSLEAAMEPSFGRDSFADYLQNLLFGTYVARESTLAYVDASQNPFTSGE